MLMRISIKIQKIMIAILFAIIGLSATTFIAHQASRSFEIAREYHRTTLLDSFMISGYLLAILSLFFLVMTFLLCYYGPDNVRLKEDNFESTGLKCSYCHQRLGKSYSFNSIFVKPTIYKCNRWWCTLGKKLG